MTAPLQPTPVAVAPAVVPLPYATPSTPNAPLPASGQMLVSRICTWLATTAAAFLMAKGWITKDQVDGWTIIAAGVLVTGIGNVATYAWNQRARLGLWFATPFGNGSAPAIQPIAPATIDYDKLAAAAAVAILAAIDARNAANARARAAAKLAADTAATPPPEQR